VGLGIRNCRSVLGEEPRIRAEHAPIMRGRSLSAVRGSLATVASRDLAGNPAHIPSAGKAKPFLYPSLAANITKVEQLVGDAIETALDGFFRSL
jgi:hypothetical protein